MKFFKCRNVTNVFVIIFATNYILQAQASIICSSSQEDIGNIVNVNNNEFDYVVPSKEQKQLCQDKDNPGVPIFVDKRSICNFDSIPILVYTVRMLEMEKDDFLCLKGDFAEHFVLNQELLKLHEHLNQTETSLKIQVVRNEKVARKLVRKTLNAFQLDITIRDCSQADVSWQTVLVAVLASICVILISSLSVLFILYQQARAGKRAKTKSSSDKDNNPSGNKSNNNNINNNNNNTNDSSDNKQYNKNKNNSDEDDDDTRGPHGNEETFINPRRTSLYDYQNAAIASSSMNLNVAKVSISSTNPINTIEMKDIPEE